MLTILRKRFLQIRKEAKSEDQTVEIVRSRRGRGDDRDDARIRSPGHCGDSR